MDAFFICTQRMLKSLIDGSYWSLSGRIGHGVSAIGAVGVDAHRHSRPVVGATVVHPRLWDPLVK